MRGKVELFEGFEHGSWSAYSQEAPSGRSTVASRHSTVPFVRRPQVCHHRPRDTRYTPFELELNEPPCPHITRRRSQQCLIYTLCRHLDNPWAA